MSPKRQLVTYHKRPFLRYKIGTRQFSRVYSDMRNSFLLLVLFLFASQIVSSQIEKEKDDSKFPSNKFFILSCQSDMNQIGALNNKVIKLVKPQYPKQLLEEGKSGAVTVRVTVNEKGNVISASAFSRMEPQFHQLAVDAAKKSKFKRFIRCGKPVKITGNVIYNFILPE